MKRLHRFLLLIPGLLGLAAGALAATPSELADRAWLQEQNIPRWVRDVFAAKKLDGKYEFSFHLNPFYLRGDFNGDRIPDVAVLVKEKKSGKSGILIVHGTSKQSFILGAGQGFGNSGDDFSGINIWEVYLKGPVERGVGMGPPPLLKGEALWVERAEAASALIYWDGKAYKWYQQGD